MTGLYDIRNPQFGRLVHKNARLEQLWTGGRWCEGPAYVPAGKYLIWSDIPNDRVLRFDETDGSVSTFQSPCGNQNGHILDRSGRLVACEHQGRCVSRIEHDGMRSVIADHFMGKRLNSPNDVVVKSDGTVWFSDPTYGIDSDYEGDAASSEIGKSQVYRVEGDGTITAAVTDMVQPNGLAFSPDERLLYVADTGRSHKPDCLPKIRAYPVREDGMSLGPGADFIVCDNGAFDGFRVDTNGNLWCSAGDGVHCFTPAGELLGKIRVPEVVSNLCFFGPKRNRLAICATSSLYAVYVNARGL
ncbi:SMP-30/gluconolactonase/LRE family protein [Rhizobium halophytocola]|uniref:Gluconolactonase n=1 Tax=Rhizobium halophytocola TaxID=735519 RepID=A0ABS4DTY3_9HYPH|nr:SMP-30/gluconolactonase/LRE family protein [Rhizobium halophytocola]MBP1849158.1 gluconolactonase [Rhizobium halophytocola]